MLSALFDEFKSSIKSPDTEEKLDLILYRPCGFLIAKIAHFIGLTPSMLSLMGLFSGFLSAWLFLDHTKQTSLILASFFLVLSGIFDSSDGQLARIANQSTKLGLILDGICDSLVTIAVYLSCALPYFTTQGPIVFLVLIAALHFHSCQCAILDFYHREYLFFGYGKTENDTYWNPGIAEGKKLIAESSGIVERTMNQLRLTWIKKQQMLTTRYDIERLAMREFLLRAQPHEKEKFTAAYRKHNLKLLSWWRLIGVNAHTALMIFFMFIGRFDIYVIGIDLILLNVIIVIMGMVQRKADQKFLKEVSSLREAIV